MWCSELWGVTDRNLRPPNYERTHDRRGRGKKADREQEKVLKVPVEEGSGFTLTSSRLILSTLKEGCESLILGPEGVGLRGELKLQKIKITCPKPHSCKVADLGFDSASVAVNFTHFALHDFDYKRC